MHTETHEIHLRPVRPEDALSILEIYGPVIEKTSISFELEVPTLGEFQERIRTYAARNPWLVSTETDGKLSGYAYASEHRARRAYQWTVEVSVYVHPNRHRTGTGKILYNRLFQLLRQQGYRTALAGITLPNSASVGFHESFGFEHLGTYRSVGYKLGAWHDVGWWQLQLLPESPLPPAPPAPWLGKL